jgi:hypothetical protein
VEKKLLRAFTLCPFFTDCDEKVDFAYIYGTCIGGYKECRAYDLESARPIMKPREWYDKIEEMFYSLGLDDAFYISSFNECPMFDVCQTKVSHASWLELCTGEYEKCCHFYILASSKKTPDEWRDCIKKIVKVMEYDT